MSEAIFGFFGVIIGSAIPWIQSTLSRRDQQKRDGNYLAVRVVSILEKYIYDCVDVVYDDGTAFGQPAGKDGYHEDTAKNPGAITFPDDINWKSIPPSIMFKLLLLPSEAENINRKIAFSQDFAEPPDYCEYYSERQKGYAALGFKVVLLKEELCNEYNISLKTAKEWSPKFFFKETIEKFEEIEKRKNEGKK